MLTGACFQRLTTLLQMVMICRPPVISAVKRQLRVRPGDPAATDRFCALTSAWMAQGTIYEARLLADFFLFCIGL